MSLLKCKRKSEIPFRFQKYENSKRDTYYWVMDDDDFGSFREIKKRIKRIKDADTKILDKAGSICGEALIEFSVWGYKVSLMFDEAFGTTLSADDSSSEALDRLVDILSATTETEKER